MGDETERGRRRVRYRGTHPRHYAERYKELDPERHARELEKVRARGDTPAGTHRPVCVREILEVLDPRPGDVGLDATLGFGGHAQEILPRLLPGGRLFGIDVDPLELPRTEARMRGLGFSADVLVVRRMNFAGVSRWLSEEGNALARKLVPFLDHRAQLDRYIAACQLGITATSLILGAYGQNVIAGALHPALEGLTGMSPAAAQSVAATGVLLALTALQMVLSELFPKSILASSIDSMKFSVGPMVLLDRTSAIVTPSTA